MFPRRALLLTKQSSAKMSQDHRSEKYLRLFLSLTLWVLFAEIPFSMHSNTVNIFSLSLPLLHLWVIDKVAKQEEQFHNNAV